MLVFIDESGDAGFKVDSSPYLVISMVIFEDYNSADETRDLIKTLISDLKVKPEFRFTNCSDKIRTQFFNSISTCNFYVKCIVVKKTTIKSHFLRNHPSKFYNHTLRHLITHNALAGAKIRIDGSAKREFQKAAKSYLCKETPIGAVTNLKFQDSKKEPLIQLADMVSGAIGRSYNRPEMSNKNLWKNMINSKIQNIWEFK